MTLRAVGLGKALGKFLPGAQKRRERFLLYFRLYTHAIRASSNFARGGAERSFLHVQIVSQLTQRTRDYPEEDLLMRIHRIAEALLAQQDRIRAAMKKGSEAEQAQTQLLLIENLCTLRLLRLLAE